MNVTTPRGRITCRIAGPLMILLLVASCRPYLDRIDTVNFAGGEANAANKAIHTIDPWPPGAFKKHQNTSAKRLAKGAEHYDEGPPKEGKELETKTNQ